MCVISQFKFATALLTLFVLCPCFAEQESEEYISPEVIETIQEAPDLVEDLVLTPPHQTPTTSPWILGPVIFSLTFFIEEVAIATSAYLIASDRIGHFLGFFTLFIGIFLSDIFIYVLGVLVARSRWIQNHVDVPYYQAKVKQHLDRGLWVTVLISRFVPGMLLPIFLILGFTRTNLYKVSLVTFFITCAYSALALYILLYMGLQISDVFGSEMVLALSLIFIAYLLHRRLWNFLRIRYHILRAPKPLPWPKISHSGMPSLQVPRHRTFFEGLPTSLAYAPLVGAYCWYALRFRSLVAPLAANPGIENSGICGESKAQILSAFPSQFSDLIPRLICLLVEEPIAMSPILERLRENGLNFPLVAKPNIGQMSRGVELIRDPLRLQDYLERFPKGQHVILQEYVLGDGEAGIFYARLPHTEKPLIHVALTYFPFVIGDNSRSVGELVRQDPRFAHHFDSFTIENFERIPKANEVVRLKLSGSTRDGCIHTIMELPPNTPLEETIHRLSQSIPEFWIGRFDVKFASLEDLKNGNFKILELNGAAGEDLTAWDPNKGIRHCYKTLFQQMKWLFEIGQANQRRGCTPVAAGELLKAYIEQESLLYRLTRAHYYHQRRRAREQHAFRPSSS